MHLLRWTFFLLLTPFLVSQEPLPRIPLELESYIERTETRMAQKLNYFLTLPDEEKSYETMMRPWNRFSNEIISHLSMLSYLMTLDLSISASALEAIVSFQEFLIKECMGNAAVRNAFKVYINEAISRGDPLTPNQRYELLSLLRSYQETPRCGMLEAMLTIEPPLPYTSWISATPDKRDVEDGITVLNCNSCLVPGDFPYLYGGVAQVWQERVAPLIEKLLQADADIVCLQEAFSQDASDALYEALQGHYTYFYGAIAPRTLGFSFETIGIPSGLFVASKYPIVAPQFTAFSQVSFPINYGLFDFLVTDGERPLAHIYTTHMQAFDHPLLAEARALQLQQILDKMAEDYAKEEDLPYFLCGDLNINCGKGESSEKLLKKYFYNDYLAEGSPITEANSTYTDYFSNYKLDLQQPPHFQILDYALLLRNGEDSKERRILTKRISMNQLTDPERAISDHHGLLTYIRLGKS